MNKVVLVGRLTRDPEVRYSQGDNATAVARYTLAVDRRFRRDGEPTADFIPCVIFGRSAEFAEKYFHQGMRVSISGRIHFDILLISSTRRLLSALPASNHMSHIPNPVMIRHTIAPTSATIQLVSLSASNPVANSRERNTLAATVFSPLVLFVLFIVWSSLCFQA